MSRRSFSSICRIALIVMVFGALTVSMLFAGGLDPLKEKTGAIKVAGGTALIPVMEEAAKQLMQLNPNMKLDVTGGDGIAIEQVAKGLAEIGNLGRTPTDEEVQKYGLKAVKLAYDGAGVVVNPENGVKALTKAQLKDVFEGKVDNWKLVGGVDKAINVYSFDKTSGTHELFSELALAKGAISTKATIVADSKAMKAAIAGDPFGIGYIPVGLIDKSVAAVTLDGIAITLETVKNGTYPIARSLVSITKGEPTELAKMLLDYILSNEGQKIVLDKGLIPVK